MPMMISNASDNYGSLFVSYVSGQQQETIAFLKALHERLTGNSELKYAFVEDEIADFLLLRVVIAFALVGIFISLMGFSAFHCSTSVSATKKLPCAKSTERIQDISSFCF